MYKGFRILSCVSHDFHLDIDRDVSTAYCRSSLRDSVELLSRTTTVVVGDWCILNFAHGGWVSIQSMCKTLSKDIKHKSLYYLLIVQDKINLQLSKIASYFI